MENEEKKKLAEVIYEWLLSSDVIIIGSSDQRRIVPPFDVQPGRYLQLAEDALADCSENELRLVDAVSNVKRAIECQMDALLYAFGWLSLAARWPFPKKLSQLDRLGFVSPRILKRINDTWNELEHRHKLPQLSEVETAIDVAALFLAYTDPQITQAVDDAEFSDYLEEGGGCMWVSRYPEEGRFHVERLWVGKLRREDFSIAVGDPGYELLATAFALANYLGDDENKKRFNEAVMKQGV